LKYDFSSSVFLYINSVDAQSFPFDSPSAPNIVKGAYSPSLTYTVDNISDLTYFAAQRGIRLLLEVDVPGHAACESISFNYIHILNAYNNLFVNLPIQLGPKVNL
jgi:hexosaminidase